MSPSFRSLSNLDLSAFSAGVVDVEAFGTSLGSLLRNGTTRPEWCWVALDDDEQPVARQAWWASPGASVPVGVDLLGTQDSGAAVALLDFVRDLLGVREAVSMVFAAADDPRGPSGSQPDLVSVLQASGFALSVERVRVEWLSGSVVQPPSGRLEFCRADEVHEATLVALFASVADGALDDGMIEDRARLGAESEAEHRLLRARSYRADAGWFRVALDARGEPVVYVVPGMAGDAPMIAEIGVSSPHRGKRYVDDLLAEETRLLIGAGAARIVADTDLANSPMRAAFRRGGFREFQLRDDYQWTK